MAETPPSRAGISERFGRFVVVGSVTTIAYILAVALLVDLLGLPEASSAAIAYATLLPLNFLGHRRVTFRSRRPPLPEAIRFVVMHATTAAVSAGLMWLVTGPLSLVHWIGSAVVAVFAPLFNLFVMEVWVFAAGGQTSASPRTTKEKASTALPADFAIALPIALTWSAGAAATTYFLRSTIPAHAFSIRPSDILGTLGFAWALTVVAPLVIGLRSNRDHAWLLSVCMIWAVVAVVWALGPPAPAVVSVVIVGVLIAGLIPALRAVMQLGLWGAAAGIAGAIGGVANVLLMTVSGYAHPLALETTLAGTHLNDTMFHASLAGFLTEYGVATIGVDGLVPLEYHVLSHRIIGAVGAWLSTAPINAYSLYVPIVGVPLAVFHLIWVTALLRHRTERPERALIRALTMLALVFLIVGFGGRHMWVSESFLVSIPPFLAAIGIMAVAPQGAAPRARADLIGGVVLAALLAMAALSKISTGAVLAAGICLWFALRYNFTLRGLALALLFGALPFVAVYLSAPVNSGHADASLFGPLTLLIGWPGRTIFHILFIGAVLWATLRPPPRDHFERDLALSLGAMAVVAMIVALLIDLEGASALYIASPGIWACLALLALNPPHWRFLERAQMSAGVAIAAALYLTAVITSDGFQKAKVLEVRLAQARQGLPETSPFWPIAIMAREVDGLFVSPSADEFWTSFRSCYSGLLALPSVTTKPFVLGWPGPASKCTPSRFYGFGSYTAETSSQRELDDDDLCNIAKSRGMHSVARIGYGLSVRRIDCP